MKFRKKVQQYGIAMFATVTVVGSTVYLQEEEFLNPNGNFVIKVIGRGENIGGAKITLVNKNTLEKEIGRTDLMGFARLDDTKGKRWDDKSYERPSGSYSVWVEKGDFPQRKVDFYLEQNGFVEQIVELKKPRKRKADGFDYPEGHPWEAKAMMPKSKSGLTANAFRRKIFLFGGYDKKYLNNVEEYIPFKDQWNKKAPMPIPRDHHTSSAARGKIYVAGGHNKTKPHGLAVLHVYDPAADTWEEKSPMRIGRYSHASCVLRDRIYVFGGKNAGGGTASVEVYDTRTDTWEPRANMPHARYYHTCSLVYRKMVVVGGKSQGVVDTAVLEYDPKTDRWKAKKLMPTGRYYHAAGVVDNRIVVVGGHGGANVVEEYNPITDAWSAKTEMPSQRYNLAGTVFDRKIYVFGGHGGPNANERYDPMKDRAARASLEQSVD
ncbi:MAG: hypothetical protein GY866_31085 [Proteobacteria bacterium]|nr:hypothetical protein [Pseudomonadota bacterium]